MKIGIDARLYRSSAAGIGRYSQNLIKNLLEIDQENQYVLFMTKKDIEEFHSIKKNVKVIETNIEHYSLSEQTKLAKIIERENCDLVHFTNVNFPANFRGKFVVTIHDMTLFFYPGRIKKSFVYRWAYQYIFKKACFKSAKIITDSESTKQDIIKAFKVSSKKIKTIYLAADDKTFVQPSKKIIDNLKSKYAIDNLPVLLYVGQWRSHKNIEGLVKAFDRIRQNLPCKLVLIGKVDLAYPQIKETIDKANGLRDIITPDTSDMSLRSNVIMPGFVSQEELAGFCKIASVFVFPSFYEGFGLPGLEAMMASTPVVSSNRTSLPEIYGEAAVYFNPSDIEDMAQKIKSVLVDKNLQNELVAKGQKLVKNFSWNQTAEETLKIYKTVIHGDL